ncbi:MAG TPA: hypothetical protein VIS74_06855 [Chthoniobacterales bacterium]
MKNFPYTQYEGTLLWEALANALEKLKENRDIVIATADPYVIGYLAKAITQALPSSIQPEVLRKQ